MVTLLLADTDPKLRRLIHEVEGICHAVGLGLIVHHEGEDLEEVLDSVDAKVVVFSPDGKLTLAQMIDKYPDGNVLLVVGGFTEERDFRSDVRLRADATVSLGKDFLPIPAVIERIIEAYEKTP